MVAADATMVASCGRLGGCQRNHGGLLRALGRLLTQ